MRKSVLSLSIAAALAVPGVAAAQATPTPALTSNVSVVSDYRFRGLSQTFQRPALQGGFDYAHKSGFYLGNWNSNVSSALYPNANLEMDFYGGYKPTFGDITADLGAIYYFYPGSRATITNLQTGQSCGDCKIDNKELYIGGAWRWLGLKYYHAIDDFFGIPGTKNSFYVDSVANFDLGGGWGVVGHIGHQKVKRFTDASYTDYKLGVTKDIRGFVFGAAWVDTSAKGGAGQPYAYSDARKTNLDIGKSGLVFSVNRTF
jgi:uncharacterized protein (TIGR02001 family)